MRVFAPRRSGTVMQNGYTSPEESLLRPAPNVVITSAASRREGSAFAFSGAPPFVFKGGFVL
jgi:hypothetical protein